MHYDGKARSVKMDRSFLVVFVTHLFVLSMIYYVAYVLFCGVEMLGRGGRGG